MGLFAAPRFAYRGGLAAARARLTARAHPDKSALMAISDTKYLSADYADRVEQAIQAHDVDALVEFAYGYPCRCAKRKGSSTVSMPMMPRRCPSITRRIRPSLSSGRLVRNCSAAV